MYEVCSKQKGEQMALKYGSRDSLNAQISHQKYSVIEEWMQYHLDNNLDCVESGNRNEKIFKLLPDMALVDGFRYCANCKALQKKYIKNNKKTQKNMLLLINGLVLLNRCLVLARWTHLNLAEE